MYGISTAAGSALASGAGAAVLPSTSATPGVALAHQALAFTGVALGGYVLVALILILAGLIMRWSSGISQKDH